MRSWLDKISDTLNLKPLDCVSVQPKLHEDGMRLVKKCKGVTTCVKFANLLIISFRFPFKSGFTSYVFAKDDGSST